MKTIRAVGMTLLCLLLSAIIISSSCGNSSSKETSNELKIFAAAAEYSHEYFMLEALTHQRLVDAEAQMRNGELDMRQLYTRFHEIYFAEALGIEYLDSLPQYSLLMATMWLSGTPAKLAWAPTDYLYQQDYKRTHDLALLSLMDTFEEWESNGIDLQYDPLLWDDNTLYEPEEDSPLVKSWQEVQSIEGEMP